MTEPTFEQVNQIYLAILLDKPILKGFPETERALRAEIEEIVTAGGTPDIPE